MSNSHRTKHEESLLHELKLIEEAAYEVKCREAAKDFSLFTNMVMVDEDNIGWQVASHQEEWGELLNNDNITRLQIMAPRLHGKTTYIMAWILFRIGQNPNTTIKYVCGDDNLAIDIVGQISDNIINNETYHKIFPHIKPQPGKEWSKHKIYVIRPAGLGIKDATVEASGVTASGTGGRCHILILDDIIDPRVASIQPNILPKIQGLVEQDWINLLYVEQSRVVMIGTPWSYSPPDIYVQYADRGVPYNQINKFERHGEWVLWKKPAVINGEPLWPEKWTIDRLEERKRGAELAFRQQFMLEGFRTKQEWFAEEWLQQCIRYDLTLGEDIDPTWPRYTGVDPALSQSKQGSRSAIFTAALAPDGKRWPVSIVICRATAQELARVILDINAKEHPVKILVENNGYQAALMDLINIIGGHEGVLPPLFGQFTGNQKFDPEMGVPKLGAEIAQGMWVIPLKGDNHGKIGHSCPVCEWLTEMRKYGKENYTTDIIMAMWLADCAIEGTGKFGNIMPITVMTRRTIGGNWSRGQ